MNELPNTSIYRKILYRTPLKHMGIRLAKTSCVHIIRTTLVIILIHLLCSSCSNLSGTQYGQHLTIAEDGQITVIVFTLGCHLFLKKVLQ
jgi:hypothetical protein